MGGNRSFVAFAGNSQMSRAVCSFSHTPLVAQTDRRLFVGSELEMGSHLLCNTNVVMLISVVPPELVQLVLRQAESIGGGVGSGRRRVRERTFLPTGQERLEPVANLGLSRSTRMRCMGCHRKRGLL